MFFIYIPCNQTHPQTYINTNKLTKSYSHAGPLKKKSNHQLEDAYRYNLHTNKMF